MPFDLRSRASVARERLPMCSPTLQVRDYKKAKVMSMTFDSRDAFYLTRAISEDRLRRLAEMTGDRFAAIQIHQDTLALNGQLMKLVATVEIGLRNIVYATVADYFGVQNWLQQPPIRLNLKEMERRKIAAAHDCARRSEYAKMSQAQKGHLRDLAFPLGKPLAIKRPRFNKLKREQIAVPDGKVVAELTLGFWKRLYSADYEQELWRTALKRTFPNKSLKRAQVASQLEIIVQMRNRLAHHEAVFAERFEKLGSAIEFVASELDSRGQNEPTALAKMLGPDLAVAKRMHVTLATEIATYKSR